MVGGYSASLQTSSSASGGDTSRQGQSSGIVGAVVSLVSGKGNTATQTPSTSAAGLPQLSQWAWIALACAGAGVVVYFTLRKK